MNVLPCYVCYIAHSIFFTDAIVQTQCNAMELTNKIVQEQAEDMKQKLEILSSKEVVNL